MNAIVEGLKTTILGMGVTFSGLALLWVAVSLTGRFAGRTDDD